MHLEIQPDCLERLKALGSARIVLLPNHPTYHDWNAIFMLSARLGEMFHYLAAYERFQGFEGWFIQHLGAYSIRRGLGDRPSVAKTLELLMQPEIRLVIFPEGGCSLQNDTVMPFRSGAVQIPLQALSKLARHSETVPDLYLVPVSIKYRYTGNMRPTVRNTLSRLERALRIYRSAKASDYERLRAIAKKVLVGIERDYDLYSFEVEQLGWNQRIARLKKQVLQSCEEKLGIEPAGDTPLRERVYKLQHVLELQAEQLSADDFWNYEAMHHAAVRLLNFDAIYDGYVADYPTPERFLDTLVRMEREVFSIGYPAPKGHRRVMLRIGQPVNLKEHFKAYQQDRSGTVNQLLQTLHQDMQLNLNSLFRDANYLTPEESKR